MIGTPLLWCLGGVRSPRAGPTSFRKIGIMQTAAIGDTLLMAGHLSALRRNWPQALITLFFGRDNGPAARLLQGYDRLVPLDLMRPDHALRQLRAEQLDVLIDCGPWPRLNALLTWAAGARLTIGFATRGEGRHYAFDLTVEHRSDRHETDNQAALFALLTQGVSDPPRLAIGHEPSTIRRRIVFHPWAGGSGKRNKQWPGAYWQALAAWARDHRLAVALTGGPTDLDDGRDLAKQLRAEVDGLELADFTGRLSLEGTAEILMGAAAVVSVNTGTMHLAAMLGCPTIGLCGPTSARRWGPIGPKAISVESPHPDAGYLNLGFEFPKDPPPVMEALTPDLVIDGLDHLLRRERLGLLTTPMPLSGRSAQGRP